MDSHPFNVLSLCSGAGGLDLGIKLAVPTARVVCFVEREAFCCEILAQRMEEGALDDAPVWTDLRAFDGRPWRGVVDCVTAGFPCQPFSCAGKKAGVDDPRHLWPHVLRVLRETEPSVVFLENVPGLLTVRCPDGRTAAQLVFDELADSGFELEAGLFTAAEVGAPQRRSRLFVLGVADAGWNDDRWRTLECRMDSRPKAEKDRRALSANRTNDVRADLVVSMARRFAPGPDEVAFWKRLVAADPSLEPTIRGMVDGLAPRLDRLRAIGNGVVPAVAKLAWSTLAFRLGQRQAIGA